VDALPGTRLAAIGEMSGAMFAPFVLLLAPFWVGLISAGGLLGGGHVLMLPFMLGVMLLRWDEYSQHHMRHARKSRAAEQR
jgi:hypothetical protein